MFYRPMMRPSGRIISSQRILRHPRILVSQDFAQRLSEPIVRSANAVARLGFTFGRRIHLLGNSAQRLVGGFLFGEGFVEQRGHF
jgi:hypothetical protein